MQLVYSYCSVDGNFVACALVTRSHAVKWPAALLPRLEAMARFGGVVLITCGTLLGALGGFYAQDVYVSVSKVRQMVRTAVSSVHAPA